MILSDCGVKDWDVLCRQPFCISCNSKPRYPKTMPNNPKNTPIWNLVIRDMTDRDHFGRQKYGTPLTRENGRNAIKDAYEEVLDLAVYLRQVLEEQQQFLTFLQVYRSSVDDPMVASTLRAVEAHYNSLTSAYKR